MCTLFHRTQVHCSCSLLEKFFRRAHDKIFFFVHLICECIYKRFNFSLSFEHLLPSLFVTKCASFGACVRCALRAPVYRSHDVCWAELRSRTSLLGRHGQASIGLR